MAVTIEQAEQIVLDHFPGADVKSAIEFEGKYLFIAHWDDPFEGHLDPFFSVEKETGYFRDWSPSNYPNPLEVITLLDKAAR